MSEFSEIEIHADLVRRARAGDVQAHEAIYKAFSSASYTLLYRLVGNADVARELLQDTFVEVLAKIADFRAEAPIGCWIRRIAVNKAMMHFRAYWNRNRRPFYEVDAQPATSLISYPESDLTDLERALGQLSPESRAVVWLHEVEGYTHGEIAALTGHSASYSKSRLLRALEQMRAHYAGNQEPAACMQVSNS